MTTEHHAIRLPARDAKGHKGAAACIIIPALKNDREPEAAKARFVDWARADLDFHRLTFFARDTAFNIGWHENPDGKVRGKG